jgi:hypothetical protein
MLAVKVELLRVRVISIEAYFLLSMESKEEKDEIPKWANFICPSCSISYGINALIKAIRKRQQKVESSNSLRQN